MLYDIAPPTLLNGFRVDYFRIQKFYMSIYQTESVRRVTGKNDGESILINIAEHSLAFPLK